MVEGSAAVDTTTEALAVIGAQVHTYESFGRAIVSHVINQISKKDGPIGDRAVGAQFTLRPIVRQSSTDVPTVHCVLVTVDLDGTTTYSVVACVVIPDIHIETF
jgi:hypothetical protein